MKSLVEGKRFFHLFKQNSARGGKFREPGPRPGLILLSTAGTALGPAK